MRTDKYQVGDEVEFRSDLASYDDLDLISRFQARMQQPYKVTAAQNKPTRLRRASSHTQYVTINDKDMFSGFWFKPIER